MPEPSTASVVALAADLVADQQVRDSLYLAWLNGTADGGPNGDGKYPLPAPTGSTLVPCWASLTDPLTGVAAEAQTSAEGAHQALTSAEALKARIDTIKTAIDGLIAQALSYRNEARARANDAAAEHAAARAERETCEQLKADMQQMLDDWAAANQ